MPRVTPDVLEAAIKCFHLNSGQLLPEFVVIHSPHAALFAVTTKSSFVLRSNDPQLSDWQIAINLNPNHLLQLMGIAAPPTNDLIPSSAHTLVHDTTSIPPDDEAV